MPADHDSLATSSGDTGTLSDREAGQAWGGSGGEATSEVHDDSLGSRLDPAHDWAQENEVHNRLEQAGAVERRFQESHSHLKKDQSDIIMTAAMRANM